MSIWVGQRVRTYDVANLDNYGQVGTVVESIWIDDPDSGEDRMSPALVIELDNGSIETSFVRDCRLDILDGEDE